MCLCGPACPFLEIFFLSLRGCPSSTSFLAKTIVALTALILLSAVPVPAHDFAFTEATLLIQRDGAFRIDLRVDVDALALGVSPTTDSAEVVSELQAMTPAELAQAVENARQTVLRRVRLRFDSVKQRPEISFPEQGTELALENELPHSAGTDGPAFGKGSRRGRGHHLWSLAGLQDGPPHPAGSTHRPVQPADPGGRAGQCALSPAGRGSCGGDGEGRIQLSDSGVRAHSSRRGGPHTVRAGPVSPGAAVSTASLAGDRLYSGSLGDPGPFELRPGVAAFTAGRGADCPLHRLRGRREPGHLRAEALAPGGGIRIRPVGTGWDSPTFCESLVCRNSTS